MRCAVVVTVYYCLAHARHARNYAEDLQLWSPDHWGVDTSVMLRASLPRRYGGGSGTRLSDQLPLAYCFMCEGDVEPDG